MLEVNYDGLIGPTHHYGGLSHGNIASASHRHQVSNPKQAALEGLEKMKLVADFGIPQALLPPHERPHFGFLRGHGFAGSEQSVIKQAAEQRLDLLSIAYSASAMWTANAATVSPGSDTVDGRVHFTPANLFSTVHRQLEPPFTTHLLRAAFPDATYFQVHDPFPSESGFADEGAANHMRLCRLHGDLGVEFFAYGRSTDESGSPQNYPARQAKAASEAVVRRHGLDNDRVVLARQSPVAIDAGVFHNDVIAVANESLLLCHEQAFVDQENVLTEVRDKFPQVEIFQVSADELSIESAVATYLFNSQLLTLPDASTLLLCPADCKVNEPAHAVIQRIVANTAQISAARFVDVRQSMQNGGGPACLRLRVVLSPEQLAAVHQGLLFTDDLYEKIKGWIEQHYREELSVESLGDPQLVTEVRMALDELTEILGLGSLYPFQR
jgi:succinylarginine dihydrolase